MRHSITIEFDDPKTVKVSSQTRPNGSDTLLALTHATVAVIEKCSTCKLGIVNLRRAVLSEFNRMMDNIEAKNATQNND